MEMVNKPHPAGGLGDTEIDPEVND